MTNHTDYVTNAPKWKQLPHTYLRAWREFVDLTQTQLADKLGTTGATISRFETGERPFDSHYLFAFAAACGCSNPGDPINRLPDGIELPDNIGKNKSGKVIRHIRKQLFHLTQTEFAAVAGVRQSSVSRWERGTSPTLNELQAIRQAAIERDLAWDDSLFFKMRSTATGE